MPNITVPEYNRLKECERWKEREQMRKIAQPAADRLGELLALLFATQEETFPEGIRDAVKRQLRSEMPTAYEALVRLRRM